MDFLSLELHSPTCHLGSKIVLHTFANYIHNYIYTLQNAILQTAFIHTLQIVSIHLANCHLVNRIHIHMLQTVPIHLANCHHLSCKLCFRFSALGCEVRSCRSWNESGSKELPLSQDSL